MKLFSTLFLAFNILFMFSVNATVVVSNGLTHIHESAQGNTIRGTIEVKNIGELPEKIIISKQDLLKYCDPESSDNKPALNHSRSLNNWIDLSVLEKELSPGEEFSIIYDISVPDDESLLGSYWTMVIVEISRPIKRNQMDHGFTIDSKIRYGIQVITNIGQTTDLNENQDSTEDSSSVNNPISDSLANTKIDSINNMVSDSTINMELDSTSIANSNSLEGMDSTAIATDSISDEQMADDEYEEGEEYGNEEEEQDLLDFIDLKLDKRDGVQFVYTKLENYDVFMMNIAIIIDIYDEYGELVKKLETSLKKLYPNSCVQFEIPLEDILPGNYDAIIVADYGKDLYGINVSLTIDEK